MVDLTYENKVLTALLYGEIDHHIAPKIRAQIDMKTETFRPKVLRLDFKGVTFMDSSGVGLVMGRYRFSSLLGSKLEVVNIPPFAEKVFSLSGIGSLGVMK